MRYRTRLTLVYVILIGFSVLTAGLFSAQLLRNSYISALETNMSRELHVILTSFDWRHTGNPEQLRSYYSPKIQELKESADARMTYILADGTVISDSDHDPATMGNHLDRKEIKEALLGKTGYSVRYSSTMNQNMMYAAVAVKDDAGATIAYIRLATSLTEVETSLRRFWFFMLAGLAGLFAAAGFIGFHTAGRLTHPLEKITRVAQQITNLDYKSRVKIKSKDEIGQLGDAINTMADSLQNQLRKIMDNESRLQSVLDNMSSGIVMVDRDKRIVLLNRTGEEFLGFSAEELLGRTYSLANQQYEFSELIGDCLDSGDTLRDELVFYFPEERILEVNASPMLDGEGNAAGVLVILHNITAMRRLERMRSEFVANVSHELKTPIAAVQGFAETLLAGALEDKEIAKTFVQIIFDESERLNRLVGDILELSKIESKRVPLVYSPVNLYSFVNQSFKIVQREANRKHIHLGVDIDPTLYLEADEDRLRQILLNLLSNGIAYTPEGGEIQIKAESSTAGGDGEERVRITVSDTGIGIPTRDLPRVFERFYRVDKARSRISGGTGLGLSIVKHLVELHGGSISVESILGTGSSFIIELPLIQI
ncbi:MAG: cell wall metabolism sensor histidine kinase WalK [Gorillibacterium sp.]|nr:cell wall metabolism sensor histidine kinase WalK [Gorillibacterium sp.]